MAEPLSMVLAGMALATAIKDAMEVWEKIEASFSRVSQNLRAAQQLVGDIRSTLDHLSEFCEEHHETLDKSEKTRVALINLVRKMNAVHTTCSQLIPPISERSFNKYKLKYYVWKNGRKIEAEILELRRDVDNCLTLFAVFTSIRTEIRLVEFQNVNLMRSDAILNELSGLAVSNKRIRKFANPEATIPQTPSLDRKVAFQYLQFQVDTVYYRIAHLSERESEGEMSRIFDLKPPDLAPPVEEYTSQDRESLQRTTVHAALEIQYLLQPRADLLSFDTARIVLTALARMLYALGMRKLYARFIQLLIYWQGRLMKALSNKISNTFDAILLAHKDRQKIMRKRPLDEWEEWEWEFVNKSKLLYTYSHPWNILAPYPIPFSNLIDMTPTGTCQ